MQEVSKLFRANGLYNVAVATDTEICISVSKLFRAYGLYNLKMNLRDLEQDRFQSSFELTGYITGSYGTAGGRL